MLRLVGQSGCAANLRAPVPGEGSGLSLLGSLPLVGAEAPLHPARAGRYQQHQHQVLQHQEGVDLQRTVDSILPNANQTGAIWEEAEAPKAFQRCATLRWMVPVDDTATRTIGWRFFSARLDPRGQDRPELVGRESIDFVGQTEDERRLLSEGWPCRRRRPGRESMVFGPAALALLPPMQRV